MLWRIWVLILLWAVSGSALQGALNIAPPLQQALQQVRNGRYQQAIEASRELERSFPEDPLTHLIRAEAYWGLLYCETGHITSERVWHVADKKTSTYDSEFFQAVEEALKESQSWRQNPKTAAAGALYSGLAHGLRTQLLMLRGQSWKSASEGKQMRADLLDAIAKDSQLAPDAYVGLGVYNYYADVMSPLLKMIRFLLRIPGGDRERGLEQLQIAIERAELAAAEARFELARIYGIRENRHAEAHALFRELFTRHPDNALYALAAGYQAEQAGQKAAAMEYIQKAQETAERMEGVCRQRLGAAARAARERLQGRPSSALYPSGRMVWRWRARTRSQGPTTRRTDTCATGRCRGPSAASGGDWYAG